MYSAVALSILMCLTVTTTTAEHHQPCHSPNMTGILSVFDAKNHIFKALGKYFYDPLAKKLRFKTNDTETNTTLSMDVLILFKEGVFYEIDGKNQSCEKKSLHSQLHPLEVPSGSKHVSEVFLGSAVIEEERLKLDIWMGAVPETEDAKITISTTQECLPVSILYLCDTASLLFSNTFVETEIKDPDSLKVPSFCEDGAAEGTEHSFYHLFI